MKIRKNFLLLATVFILLLSMAACVESTPDDYDPPAANSAYNGANSRYTPGDCFVLNNCRGNPHANVGSKEKCLSLNGNSWVNEEAQCLSNIDQK